MAENFSMILKKYWYVWVAILIAILIVVIVPAVILSKKSSSPIINPCSNVVIDNLLIFFVEPPIIYSGISIEVTIFTSGLNHSISNVEIINNITNNKINLVTSSYNNFNQIKLIVPVGTPPGTYNVAIYSNQANCPAVLDSGLTIVNNTSLNLQSITPAFIWYNQDNPVIIESFSQSTIYSIPWVYITPKNVTNATAVPLNAIVVESSSEVSAVVKSPINPGVYDLIVVNPSPYNNVGVLLNALTITLNPPPFISYVNPGSLDTNTNNFLVGIYGENFDPNGVNLTVECTDNFWLNSSFFSALVKNITNNTVFGNFPASSIGNKYMCILTLTNQDGSSFQFSEIPVLNPASDPDSFQLGPNMSIARVKPAVTTGKPTNASWRLYVMGGSNANGSIIYNSVESAPIEIYGDLQNFTFQRNSLPDNITGAGAVTIGSFIYVIGGKNNSVTKNTVYRAEILNPLATPNLEVSFNVNTTLGTTFLKGVWYYRVSALFGPDDPNNPSGESLPGEVFTVQLPQVPGLTLNFSWDSIPDAVGYRLYRTPQPNMGINNLELLAQLNGYSNVTFVDTGITTNPNITPLPADSIGVWVELPVYLNYPRNSAAVTSALRPTTNNEYFIFIFGGENNNIYYNTYEFSIVNITSPTVPKGREKQQISSWTIGTNNISAAADFGAITLTTIDSYILPTGQYIYLSAGTNAPSTSNTDVQFTNVSIPYDGQLIFGGNYGGGTNAAFIGTCFTSFHPNNLAMVGGLDNGFGTTETCAMNSISSGKNWKNGGFNLNIGRLHHSCSKLNGFIFVVGGIDSNGNALSSSEWNFT